VIINVLVLRIIVQILMVLGNLVGWGYVLVVGTGVIRIQSIGDGVLGVCRGQQIDIIIN
jgi:hypothetical protein